MSELVYVAVVRTVKPGRETDFEQALHEFIRKSLSLPGQMGVHIIRPAPGSDSRQYGVIRAFSDKGALAAFRSSPVYADWTQFAVEMTEGPAHTEELCGLESWFTMPGAPLKALPQWKMAIATYLGVVPVTMFLALTLGKFIGKWNFVSNNLAFNAFVVALLTWVVMPLLTRTLGSWLRSD
jgi:antibiotic biosynthesis monooxygenase (ABM) superfamily enzyme